MAKIEKKIRTRKNDDKKREKERQFALPRPVRQGCKFVHNDEFQNLAYGRIEKKTDRDNSLQNL